MNSVSRAFAGRYSLDVQISNEVGIPVWRALDQVLKRWVTVYLMPRSDPRSPSVISACLRVSANSSRDAISILDVIESGQITGIATISPAEEYLGIITEWVEGETLDKRILRTGETFESEDALEVITKIARALDHAHSINLAHSRLRPHNIIFGDQDEIRVSGFGVDSAILGVDRTNGIQADIQGLGNLLFAMVTGSWPNVATDGLPAASSRTGIPQPSKVASGITESVDDIFEATQDGRLLTMKDVIARVTVGTVESVAEHASPISKIQSAAPVAKIAAPVQKMTAPISKLQNSDPLGSLKGKSKRLGNNLWQRADKVLHRVQQSEKVSRVQSSQTVTKLTSSPTVHWQGRVEDTDQRIRITIAALVSVLVFGLLGWELLTTSFQSKSDVPEAIITAPLASATALPSAVPSRTPKTAKISKISDFDPFGDGTENPDQAKLAIDGKKDTSWTTVYYKADKLSGKIGVGLLLDLGKSQDVYSVDIEFLDAGHSADVFVTDDMEPDVKTAVTLGSVAKGKISESVSSDKPLNGRYVLVWLTAIPKNDAGTWQGGITEVTVGL